MKIEKLINELNEVLKSESVGYTVSKYRVSDKIIDENEESFKELIKEIVDNI